ncbi:MAG: septum formation protein Maf [Clostridia bacterium]|nr:septum formation protein Maf [Clostridia bacterium]
MGWILASASPRRQELLSRLGVPFTVEPAENEPPADPTLPLDEAVMAVARAKAEEVFAKHPDATVLGSDTVVAVMTPEGERVLGKPRDAADAAAMLGLLQGREHRVVTAVWLCDPAGGDGFAESAAVRFYPMNEQEIAAYVASGEPMDKAGAYAIQGLGMRYIRGITGDFYTVMGLPVAKLWHFAKERGKIPASSEILA